MKCNSGNSETMKMPILWLCFVFMLIATPSVCFGWTDPDSGYGTVIPVEIRVDGEFNGVVGQLEYTGDSIDLVTFAPHGRKTGIVVLPQVYEVTKKTVTAPGVHFVECVNQHGAIASGTIDFRDQLKPKVTLVGQGGHVITNMSKEGWKTKKTYIPGIALGLGPQH